VDQSGAWNEATIAQSGLGTAASHNVASVTQNSRRNVANVMQSGGAEDHATVIQ
jgi:hypothetical protein